MRSLGDFKKNSIVRGSFNTAGLVTLGGTPAISVMRSADNSVSTAGCSLVVDAGGVTGYNAFTVDLSSDAFYDIAGVTYTVFLSTGTVGGESAVGSIIGHFTVETSISRILKNAFAGTELTIASVASQTAPTVSGGPANDIANALFVIFDDSAADTPVFAEGSYTGSTGTCNLDAAPSITLTTSDKITIVALASSQDVNVVTVEGTDATDYFGGLSISVDPAPIADAVLTELIADHEATAGSLAATLSQLQTQCVTSIPAALAAIDTVVDQIVGHTGTSLPSQITTGFNGVAASCTTALVSYDSPTKAELDAGLAALNDLDGPTVQSLCNAAMVALHLDHLLAADYDPAAKPGVATALLNELVENDSGVSRFTANAVENTQAASAAALSAYDPPTKAELDAAVTGLATQSSLNAIATNVSGIVSGANTVTVGAFTQAGSDALFNQSFYGVSQTWTRSGADTASGVLVSRT